MASIQDPINPETATLTAADETGAPRFQSAYDSSLPEIRAVSNDQLVSINIDIPSAVTTVLGSLPEIYAVRAQVENNLPHFDKTQFDNIERYTLAVGHSHAIHMSATTSPSDLKTNAELGVQKREVLVSDATALAKRRLIDPASLQGLKGPIGYKNVAFDLIALTALLRSNWQVIEGKTALTLAELDNGEALADQILTALGLREQGPTTVADATELRQKAFTLFVKCYDQIRRAIHYLRWEEGDSEEIAPSLYGGRKRKSNGVAPESQPESDLAPSVVANTEEAPATARGVAPGMPGGSPFTS